MSKIVGVMIGGKPTWHAAPAGSGNFDTLCRIDADDPTLGHEGLIEAKRGQKINCDDCRAIWSKVVSLRLRSSSFQEQP